MAAKPLIHHDPNPLPAPASSRSTATEPRDKRLITSTIPVFAPDVVQDCASFRRLREKPIKLAVAHLAKPDISM